MSKRPDKYGHVTRISFDSSVFDEVCDNCGANDGVGNDGSLRRPCPYAPKEEPLPPQRQAFVDTIKENPEDQVVRRVYADWLDEHTDEAEYANFLREWTLAKYKKAQEVLEEVVTLINEACADDDNHAVLNYDGLIESLTDYIKYEEECYTGWSTPDLAEDLIEAMWDSYELVTGCRVKPDKRDDIFRCAC